MKKSFLVNRSGMKTSVLFSALMLIVCSIGIAQETKSADNPVPFNDEDTGLFGFLDINTEEVVIPATYTWAKDFSEDLAAVYTDGELAESMLDGHTFCRGCKCGFINKSGTAVIPLTYDDVESFGSGLAAVCVKDKYGFIDKTGKIIIPLTYRVARGFTEGLALVGIYDKEFKYGFINNSGTIVIPLIYGMLSKSFKDGLALVDKGGKYGFIDKSGKAIIPLVYDYATEFEDGIANVSKNEKFGCIDKSGVEVIPVIYDNMYDFEYDVVKVELKGETFYINKKGERVENN